MSEGGLDCVLGEVLQRALVVVRAQSVVTMRILVARDEPAHDWAARPVLASLSGPPRFHGVRKLPGAAYGLTDPAHALGVTVDDADRAKIVQRSLGRHCAGVDSLRGQYAVAWVDARAAMHRDDHLGMLGGGVGAVGDGWCRRRADDVGLADECDQVGNVTSA